MVNLTEFIDENEGKIKVHWERLETLKGINPEMYQRTKDELILALEKKGLLTSIYENCYYVYGKNNNMGPKTSWGISFNFKKESDAGEYCNTILKDSKFPISICRIDH